MPVPIRSRRRSSPHCDRLRAVAFRVLGSHADAEDVVHEARLRLSRQDPAAIDNLGGRLTTALEIALTSFFTRVHGTNGKTW